MGTLVVEGIPDTVEESIAGICRSRLLHAASRLCEQSGLKEVTLTVTSERLAAKAGPAPSKRPGDDLGDDVEQRAAQFRPISPRWRLEALVVPAALRAELEAALDVIRLEREVFDGWGLREIEPFPRTVLNLHGPPGTGKTMAAHGIAHALGRPILATSYAQLESRYHGDGPRNVRGLFHAAQQQGALLFVDEAENVLSRRFEQPGQGSEQASNALRSEFLLQLEQYSGAVVFATNLVKSYDKALETRLTHVQFHLPDADGRRAIWAQMLVGKLPKSDDVSPDALALVDGICGRDIKKAVIDAAIRARAAGADKVTQQGLLAAIERIRSGQQALRETSVPLTPEESASVAARLRDQLADEAA